MSVKTYVMRDGTINLSTFYRYGFRPGTVVVISKLSTGNLLIELSDEPVLDVNRYVKTTHQWVLAGEESKTP